MQPSAEEHEEERPFLELEVGADDHTINRVEESSSRTGNRSSLVLILWLSLVLLLMSMARYLYEPILYLWQSDIICAKFLASNGTATYDESCTLHGRMAPEVDSEFKYVGYWDTMLFLVPGMLLALPLGLAADKYGREKLLLLSLSGIVASALLHTVICLLPMVFPLRLIWLASLVSSITGGYIAFFVSVFAIAAEVSTSARMCLTFLCLGCVSRAGATVSQYLTMVFGDTLALVAGLALCVSCLCVVLFAPVFNEGNESTLRSKFSIRSEISYLIDVKHLISEIDRIVRIAFRDNKRMGAFLLSLLLIIGKGINGELVLDVIPFMLLGWSVLFLVLSLIPCCRTPLAKDLWLARIIFFISLLGAFIFVFSGKNEHPLIIIFGLFIAAITNVYPLITRSVLMHLGDGKDTAALFALVGFVQGFSVLLNNTVFVLLQLLGVTGKIIEFALSVLAGVILFCIWPRPTDNGDQTERH